MYEWFLLLLIYGWSLAGVAAHVEACNRMKTWCGTPIWQEPSTYMMFFPAMIAGPFLWFFIPSRTLD